MSSLSVEETCPSCGQFAVLDDVTGWCSNCSPISTKTKLESYLAKNANELEYYITQGSSLSQAIDKLHAPNARPTCIVCGVSIKRAHRSAIFCRQKPMCRKYARRYIYLYQEKHLTKAEALSKIFEEIT